MLRHAGSTVLSVMKIIGFQNSSAVTDTWIRAYSEQFPTWESAIGAYEFPIDFSTDWGLLDEIAHIYGVVGSIEVDDSRWTADTPEQVLAAIDTQAGELLDQLIDPLLGGVQEAPGQGHPAAVLQPPEDEHLGVVVGLTARPDEPGVVVGLRRLWPVSDRASSALM